VSNTDFVNSGSYLRTVFVFISGMTTLTGFAGGAGFLGSGLGVITGAGGGVAMAVFPVAAGVATGLADAWTGCGFMEEGDLATVAEAA
jgi:hypothetical protein